MFMVRKMKLYLIASDSKYILEDKVDEIVGKSQNRICYRFSENSIQDILEEASYVSMFEEEKYLIVKNADFFGKGKINEKDTEKMIHYFDNPYPCTTLIFTTYEEIDSRKALTKKMEEVGSVISLKAPKNYDLFLDTKKKMGCYKVDDKTVRYMIDACLSNYDFLQNEIDKLSLLYQKGEEITLKEIKNITVPNVNDNVFKFVDAVITKDISTTFHLLEDLLIIKTDPLQLLNLLAREYRFIYMYKILEKKRYSSKEMAKEFKLQEWQIEKIRKEASLYHEDDLKSCLIKLSKLDVSIKSGNNDKISAFQCFLIQALEY